jgi:hypothetical protein
MKMPMTLALAGLLCVTTAVGAQTPNTIPAPADQPGPKATLKDVEWLVGQWTGTGLGGVSEEMWSAPSAGAMMGMYRLVVGGKVSFYEFFTLTEENGSLALKLKHFNPDMTGWEEKDRFVTFRLAKLEPNTAWFGGLTYRRVAPDKVEIFLAIRDKSGNVREERFELQRRN